MSSRSIFALCNCHGGTFEKLEFIVLFFENFISFRSSRILKQKGFVRFCRDSMFFSVVGSGAKMQLCAGLSGSALTFVAYCNASFFLLKLRWFVGLGLEAFHRGGAECPKSQTETLVLDWV